MAASNNKDLIPVTLWIAERGYRIRVKPEDEEIIRLAVKLADEKITELRRSFAGRDDQDFIAMCLLMYATDQVTEPHDLAPAFEHKLSSMIERIDHTLAEESEIDLNED